MLHDTVDRGLRLLGSNDASHSINPFHIMSLREPISTAGYGKTGNALVSSYGNAIFIVAVSISRSERSMN